MEREEARKVLHEKMIELGKLFYETEYVNILSSITYTEIGCPYNGIINPMEIHIFYRDNNRPEEKND
jgi:hypothetical protein